MKIKIDTDGAITHIYNEKVDLSNIGKVSIRRASHVEPTADNKWIADMGPSVIMFGITEPIQSLLGPFNKRSEALKAETEWLEENIF